MTQQLILFLLFWGLSGDLALFSTKEYFSLQINGEIKTVEDIPLPADYKRIDLKESSFEAFLRRFPVRGNDHIVHLYNGAPYYNQSTHYVILDVSVGNKDLQQCADAVMRLRAEYLYQLKNYSKIKFNFTNGEPAAFEKYAQGYRVSFPQNKTTWSKKAAEDYGYASFLKYMDLVFSYAGTYSLNKELLPVLDIHKIMPGQVFIQTGSPYGHAVIVMDVAEHITSGERIFLIAQSYMPAQDMHILVNPMNNSLSPWYSVQFVGDLITPEWTFKKEHLKRFE